MRKEELILSVEARIEELRERLAQKQAEYAEDEDALAQFERAGVLQGCGPERALLGMVSKHIVSLYDLALKEELVGGMFGERRWKEYTGDIVVYMLILGAMVDIKYVWAGRTKIEPELTKHDLNFLKGFKGGSNRPETATQATQGKGKKGKER